MPAKYTFDERIAAFWSKVDRTRGEGECWNWTASLTQGYGRVRWGTKNELAHRISYYLAYGIWPGKFLVLHSCDNPLCVNPTHLSLGTYLDNAVDRDRKGRTGDLSGEKHGRSKLREADVLQIRRMRLSTEMTYHAIGSKFGISRQQIGHIIRGENWKKVGSCLEEIS